MNKNILKNYGYLWVTLILFLGSLAGHWMFAWKSYINEQRDKGLPVQPNEYVVETARDTFENWQSEFLQLIWQVAGLAFLLCLGSPQSKEGDDRKEEKIDLLIKNLLGAEGQKEIQKLDKKYPRK